MTTHIRTSQPATARSPVAMAGFSLLEVLIAVLVLGIGVLGIAAMQTLALKNTQESLTRSQAVIAVYAIADAIRAGMPSNAAPSSAARSAALTTYNLSRTCTAKTGGTSLKDVHFNQWTQALQTTLGAGACGTVQCDGSTGVCQITVEWDDSHMPGGKSNQSISIKTQP